MPGPNDHNSSEQVDPYRLDSAIRLVGSGLTARLLGTAVGLVGGVATTSLAVRLLGLESYGALAFGLSMLAIVAAVANSGLGLATVQRAAASAGEGSGELKTRLVHAALSAGVLVGVSGGTVLAVILYFRSDPFVGEAKAVFVIGLGLLLVGRSIASVALSILRGVGRIWLTEIPDALLLVGQLGVVAVAFLAHQAHVEVVAGGYGIVGVTGAIASVAIVRYGVLRSGPVAWSFTAARQMFAIALPFATVAIATQALARLDVVILGLFRPPDEVGGYEPTLRLVDRLMQMTPLLLVATYLPASTRLHMAADLDAVGRLYRMTAKVGYVIGFPALFLLASFPETALRFLYGPDFPVLRHVVVILLVGYGIHLALGPNTTTLISLGRNRTTALIYSGVIGIVVVSAVALIPILGARGAALSTALGYLTLNLVISLVLFRHTRIHVFGRDFVVTLMTSLVALAMGLVASLLWNVTSVFVAAAMTAAVWGLWVTGLFAVRALNRQELRGFFVRES